MRWKAELITGVKTGKPSACTSLRQASAICARLFLLSLSKRSREIDGERERERERVRERERMWLPTTLLPPTAAHTGHLRLLGPHPGAGNKQRLELKLYCSCYHQHVAHDLLSSSRIEAIASQ